MLLVHNWYIACVYEKRHLDIYAYESQGLQHTLSMSDVTNRLYPLQSEMSEIWKARKVNRRL